MRCKNCKYYIDKGYATYDNPDYGGCENPKLVYHSPNGNETDNLVYMDYEGFDAGFSVGKDFGCVHFEVKNV